jgi:CRP-like cAMP-binding protein
MSPIHEGLFAPALRKLEKWGPLSEKDCAAIQAISFTTKHIGVGPYIVRQHDPVESVCIIISGLAFSSKTVGDGDRQIVALHLPGDFLNLEHAMLPTADYSIQMQTAGTVALVSASTLRELAFGHAAIANAMWLDTIVDGSILREWTANVGRRDARTRIAHLLCEFAVRLHPAGLTAGNSFEMPMTQEQLADAAGLTPVHVNRTMRDLRQDGLISTHRRTITIHDWQGLTTEGDFDAAYLHPIAPQGSSCFQAVGYMHSPERLPAVVTA